MRRRTRIVLISDTSSVGCFSVMGIKIHVGLYRNRHKATLETSPYDADFSSIFRQMERFNYFATMILNNTVCEFSSLVHYKNKVLIFTEQREQFDLKRPLMTL